MPTIANNAVPPSTLHAAAPLDPNSPSQAPQQLSPPTLATAAVLSGDDLAGPTDSEITIGNASPSYGGTTNTTLDLSATPTSMPSASNPAVSFGNDGVVVSTSAGTGGGSATYSNGTGHHGGGIAVILTSNNNSISISGACTPRAAATANSSPSGGRTSPMPVNTTSVFTTASPPQHIRSPSSTFGLQASTHLSTSVMTPAMPPALSSILQPGMSLAEQVRALRQSNLVARAEIQRKDNKIKALSKAVTETVTSTESHEEQIMNKLLRQVERIKKEKERLLVHKIVEENRKAKEEERLRKITNERARLSERLKAEEYLIRSRLSKQLEAVQKQRRALEGKVNAETTTLQELVDAFRNYQTLEEQAAKNLMIVGWNNETSLHLGSSGSLNTNTFTSTNSNVPSPPHPLAPPAAITHIDPNNTDNAAPTSTTTPAAALPAVLATSANPQSVSPIQQAPSPQAVPGSTPPAQTTSSRGFHVTHTRQLSQLENDSNASTSTVPANSYKEAGSASREPSQRIGKEGAPMTASAFKTPVVFVGVSPYALGGPAATSPNSTLGGGTAATTINNNASVSASVSGTKLPADPNALSDAFMLKQLQKEIRRARGLQADMRNRSAEFQQKRELLEERLFNWMNRRRRQDGGAGKGGLGGLGGGVAGTNLTANTSHGTFGNLPSEGGTNSMLAQQQQALQQGLGQGPFAHRNSAWDGNCSGATTINTSVAAATPLRSSGIFNDSATIASSAAGFAAAGGRERANTANSSNYQYAAFNNTHSVSSVPPPTSPTPSQNQRHSSSGASPGGMTRNSRHRNNSSGFTPNVPIGGYQNPPSPAAPGSFAGNQALREPQLHGGDATTTDISDAESNSLYAYRPASSVGVHAPTPIGQSRTAQGNNPTAPSSAVGSAPTSASVRGTPWRPNQNPFSPQPTANAPSHAPTASDAANLLFASTQQRYQSHNSHHHLHSNASTSQASTSHHAHAPSPFHPSPSGGQYGLASTSLGGGGDRGTSPSSQYRMASPSTTSSVQQQFRTGGGVGGGMGGQGASGPTGPANPTVTMVNNNRHSYAPTASRIAFLSPFLVAFSSCRCFSYSISSSAPS